MLRLGRARRYAVWTVWAVLVGCRTTPTPVTGADSEESTTLAERSATSPPAVSENPQGLHEAIGTAVVLGVPFTAHAVRLVEWGAGPRYELLIFDCGDTPQLCFQGPDCLRPPRGRAERTIGVSLPDGTPELGRIYDRTDDVRLTWEVEGGGRSVPRERDWSLSVRIDTLDPVRRLAGGRFTIGDAGREPLDVEFSAEFCPSKVVAREEATPVHGVEYGFEAVEPRDLPTMPLSGWVLGVPFVAEQITLVRGPHATRLLFFNRASNDRCQDGRIIWDEWSEAGGWDGWHGDGFPPDQIILEVNDPSLLAAGGQLVGTFAPPNTINVTSLQASLGWSEPLGFHSTNYTPSFNVALMIDAFDEEAGSVAGRAYLAFGDRSKSFAVGAFEGAVCDRLY